MMYDGQLIEFFIEIVDSRMARHGYPPPEEEEEAPPEIPLVQAA